ncbi:hypothetical protein D0Y60_06575 [Shinella sp. WSJ-2]|uniref:DUF6716 putative glycosyltransferase n=1 Tax=Shinella sp. WSJ-2 TaxID=2303749 RepID=UPI000E3E6782|nr:DUF6716 putative glycosyltransferase [Shinella sp. WSJ-2]RFZ88818.1 hypothetical protein D0Y60_06575 [Shinella sp. WSJ-2]
MRVLALAGYDSFLNAATLIAPHFQAAGCQLEYALVRSRAGRQLSQEQLESFRLTGGVRWISLEDFCKSGEIGEFDIVLSCLEGLSTRRLVHYLRQLGPNRPLLISVYPGLVLRYALDGYSMRTSSDLVWLNCQADHDDFVRMCTAFGVDSSGARVFGIASLLEKIDRNTKISKSGPVVFFEQAVIPRYHDERLFLVKQLISLVKRYPATEFIIKPRAIGKDATLHRTWHPIDSLIKTAAREIGGWPDNLRLSSEKAGALLSRASLCLTVSSTVAAEAVNAGVPTVIIGDFGAHDDYGLGYFLDSGLIQTFSEITLPSTVLPNPNWLARYVADPEKTIAGLIEEAIRMSKEPRVPIDERSPRAEMSDTLRNYLIEKRGESSFLGRKYQGWKIKYFPWLNSIFSILLRKA